MSQMKHDRPHQRNPDRPRLVAKDTEPRKAGADPEGRPRIGTSLQLANLTSPHDPDVDDPTIARRRDRLLGEAEQKRRDPRPNTQRQRYLTPKIEATMRLRLFVAPLECLLDEMDASGSSE